MDTTGSNPSPSGQLETCPFDPNSLSVISDPYPYYEQLRLDDPVHYLPEHDLWTVSRHADVIQVLTDTNTFSSQLGMQALPGITGAQTVDYRVGVPGVRVLLATDPPDHTVFRSAVSGYFRGPALTRLFPTVSTIATQLVETMLEIQRSSEIDLYRDFAGPLPVLVLAEIFGVSPDLHEVFRNWASLVTKDLAPTRSATTEQSTGVGRAYDMFRYFSEQIAERRVKPRDDLLTALAKATAFGLSDYEIVGFCVLLLVAGIETTANLLTNIVSALTTRPSLHSDLWTGRCTPDQLVEEALRFDTSVQALWRATTEETHIGSVAVPRGARLLVLFGSANRDSQVYPKADEFICDRDGSHHVAFGFGRHRCLGAGLAKMELTAAVDALVRKTGGIRALRAFDRSESFFLRGFTAQPVTLLPR